MSQLKCQKIFSSKTKKDSIWCHLCKCYFKNYGLFRSHVMTKHRQTSKSPKSDSDNKSEDGDVEDNKDVSDTKRKISNKRKTRAASKSSNALKFKNLYNNISETAVSPQSYMSTRSRAKARVSKLSQETLNQADANVVKLSEVPNQLSPQLNLISSPQNSSQMNPVINNLTFPRFILPNNQFSLTNVFQPQPLHNNFLGENQPAFSVMPITLNQGDFNIIKPTINKFDMSVEELVKFANGLKKLTTMPNCFPLKPKFLDSITEVHQAIFNNSQLLSLFSNQEKEVFLKVFEEMNIIMSKHIEAIDNQLY